MGMAASVTHHMSLNSQERKKWMLLGTDGDSVSERGGARREKNEFNRLYVGNFFSMARLPMLFMSSSLNTCSCSNLYSPSMDMGFVQSGADTQRVRRGNCISVEATGAFSIFPHYK